MKKAVYITAIITAITSLTLLAGCNSSTPNGSSSQPAVSAAASNQTKSGSTPATVASSKSKTTTASSHVTASSRTSSSTAVSAIKNFTTVEEAKAFFSSNKSSITSKYSYAAMIKSGFFLAPKDKTGDYSITKVAVWLTPSGAIMPGINYYFTNTKNKSDTFYIHVPIYKDSSTVKQSGKAYFKKQGSINYLVANPISVNEGKTTIKVPLYIDWMQEGFHCKFVHDGGSAYNDTYLQSCVLDKISI